MATGLTSFLFEGQAPPQATSYSSTSANLPDWFSAGAMGLLARANAIASEPFQAFNGPRVADFSPLQSQAYNSIQSGAGSWQPQINNALSLTGQAGAADSLGAAQPFIDQASQTAPGALSQYMNPYTSGVTDRIAELGNRNLTENILPGIQDQFIASGQAGSSRQAEFGSRAIRDTANEIAGQQALALDRGFGQASTNFQADQSRFGNLAQLTGQLTSDTAGRQLAAGQQMGALGQAQQQLRLGDAAALESAGQAQQGQQQKNLDVAYDAFKEQRDYPRQNVAFLNEALRGAAPAAQPSTTTTTTGPATTMGSSPLAQIAGAGLTAAALKKQGLFARGGRVHNFAHGGALTMVRHG
jgi:hypothetical protein